MRTLEMYEKNLLTMTAYSQRKIKAELNEVKEVISNLFVYINYFNSLPEFTMRALDMDFSEIQVISELKDFIYPASIRANQTSLLYKDLLVRPVLSDDESKVELSYFNFMSLQHEFRRFFKANASANYTTLSDLKKSVSLSDVWSRIMLVTKSNRSNLELKDTNDSKVMKAIESFNVKDDDLAFIPIPISGDFFTELANVKVFSVDACTPIKRYIETMTF